MHIWAVQCKKKHNWDFCRTIDKSGSKLLCTFINSVQAKRDLEVWTANDPNTEYRVCKLTVEVL